MAARRRRVERNAQYRTPAYRDLARRFSVNLRSVREQQGLTQEEAAFRCDMSTRLLQQVEAGDTNATLTTIARLAAGLGVDPSRLFRGGRQ